MNHIMTITIETIKQYPGVSVAAHRGTSGGGIVQNTSLAYTNALNHQATIIEVDITMSKDGVFYAFHDGQEKHVFGQDIDIRQMLSKEIDQLIVINPFGKPMTQSIEKFQDVFQRFNGKCVMNIDRSWPYWETFLPYLKELGDLSSLLLKSPVIDDRLALLSKADLNIAYMPIIKSQEDYFNVLKYPKLSIDFVEFIFLQPTSSLIEANFMQTIKANKQKIWINALSLSDTLSLAGGFDDNRAIAGDIEGSWGKLINLGFDIIQTDWPLLLHMYLEQH